MGWSARTSGGGADRSRSREIWALRPAGVRASCPAGMESGSETCHVAASESFKVNYIVYPRRQALVETSNGGGLPRGFSGIIFQTNSSGEHAPIHLNTLVAAPG